MTPKPHLITSEHEQLADLIVTRFLTLEALIMATKAELEAAHAEQMTAFTDFAADVTATLADLNARLDAALANDSADKAALEEFKTLTDDALARTRSMTEAIKAADVAVDRPA